MDQIVKTGVQIEYIYIYIWENIDKRMSLGLLMLLLFWMLRIEKCLLAGLFTLHYYVWLPCCAVRLCTFVHVCMYVCMDVCMYVCMYVCNGTKTRRETRICWSTASPRAAVLQQYTFFLTFHLLSSSSSSSLRRIYASRAAHAPGLWLKASSTALPVGAAATSV